MTLLGVLSVVMAVGGVVFLIGGFMAFAAWMDNGGEE